MKQREIDFLRNALKGDDFSDGVIEKSLEALNRLEQLEKERMGLMEARKC